MQKTVIILRGTSGSGKSFLTDLLCQNIGYVSVCADDYFTDSQGNYNFDPSKLGAAHAECQRRFVEALNEPEARTIVVANTNTKISDWTFYEETAKKVGANLIFLVVENRRGGQNTHGVPEATLQRQEENIRTSLQLIR